MACREHIWFWSFIFGPKCFWLPKMLHDYNSYSLLFKFPPGLVNVKDWFRISFYLSNTNSLHFSLHISARRYQMAYCHYDNTVWFHVGNAECRGRTVLTEHHLKTFELLKWVCSLTVHLRWDTDWVLHIGGHRPHSTFWDLFHFLKCHIFSLSSPDGWSISYYDQNTRKMVFCFYLLLTPHVLDLGIWKGWTAYEDNTRHGNISILSSQRLMTLNVNPMKSHTNCLFPVSSNRHSRSAEILQVDYHQPLRLKQVALVQNQWRFSFGERLRWN